MTELKDKTSELEGRLAELEAFFDVEGLRTEAEGLGEDMSRPGFWDDPEEARAVSARFSRSSSKRRARRTRMATSRFWCWLRSFWHWATMPVGRCVILTAESVLLTCWPPAPEAL